MTTIVLLVSRPDYLQRVITSIELLDCEPENVNILCIVDGPPELFIRTRNLIQDTKFNHRLTVQLKVAGKSSRIDIPTRRRRIAAAHNLAKTLIRHDHGFVLSVEDDTVIPSFALKRLINTALKHRAFAIVEGVELGRWSVPYVGAWKADDIYDVKKLTSMTYQPPTAGVENIDAGGLYCALIRTDLYKLHNFNSSNGLGPDVNLGIELRQLGYENFIDWSIHCKHLNTVSGVEEVIEPNENARIVTLTHVKDSKWKTHY